MDFENIVFSDRDYSSMVEVFERDLWLSYHSISIEIVLTMSKRLYCFVHDINVALDYVEVLRV